MSGSVSPASSRPSPRGGVLAGCLIVLAIVVAIVAGIGIYVGLHWKGWTADIMQQAATAIVNESDLPQDQKTQIIAEVQKLGTDFKDGKVSLDQMQKVGMEIAESPLIHLAGVQAARQKYIEPSDMTVDEKAAANRSLQRFARGVFENKIPKEAIDDVVKPITTLKPDGKWEFKEKPTRLELDQFVANAKSKADEAKIPDESFDLNIAAELKKAIDKALGRATPA
jgi:hypothetical protein